ncbi:hypothetical protein BGZ76_005434 [Entomortierella beljakovae]|nr:hypothetical protein BGZ76_005434 [Entomortierella beljakovae]
MKNSFPVVGSRLGSHSPDATVRIYDSNNKFVGYMHTAAGAILGASGRNANINDETGQLDYNMYSWDGSVVTSKDPSAQPTAVPAGTYRIVVASQKKFTKGNYPADFEIFKLGKVTIA